MASGTWRRSVADAWRCVLAATLFAVAGAAFCATVQMPGSLADEDVPHSVGEAAERWDVGFLGRRDPPLHANESSWRFPRDGTHDRRDEYFEGRLKRWQGTTGITVRPPGTVVVSLRSNFDVRSTYEVGLREACREQSMEFVASLGR